MFSIQPKIIERLSLWWVDYCASVTDALFELNLYVDFTDEKTLVPPNAVPLIIFKKIALQNNQHTQGM